MHEPMIPYGMMHITLKLSPRTTSLPSLFHSYTYSGFIIFSSFFRSLRVTSCPNRVRLKSVEREKNANSGKFFRVKKTHLFSQSLSHRMHCYFLTAFLLSLPRLLSIHSIKNVHFLKPTTLWTQVKSYYNHIKNVFNFNSFFHGHYCMCARNCFETIE